MDGAHSSEIRSSFMLKLSRKMHQKLPYFCKQGGRKQFLYGGARLNRKKKFHPESEKF